MTLTLNPRRHATRPTAFRTYAGQLRAGLLTVRGCRTRLYRGGDELADTWDPSERLRVRVGALLFVGDAILATNAEGFVVTPCDLATVVAVLDEGWRVTMRDGAVADGAVHVMRIR